MRTRCLKTVRAVAVAAIILAAALPCFNSAFSGDEAVSDQRRGVWFAPEPNGDRTPPDARSDYDRYRDRDEHDYDQRFGQPGLYIDFNDFSGDDFFEEFEQMLKQMERMQERMDRFYDHYQQRRQYGPSRNFQDKKTKWYGPWRDRDRTSSDPGIKADVHDSGTAFVVRCEIPRMDKKLIQADKIESIYKDGVLTIILPKAAPPKKKPPAIVPVKNP